ncbi:hypothetical protein QR680_004954 [Steinernema hermaphroditum]|uniref:Transmembrane protein n=1 Tax=Steinernema hermaphroditum TaxID=289476 RepID=A0AA39HSJ4_9BILA|nr:hypothetical protein QR680_004954 [Steinernema hermaphroditum]
MIGRRQAQPAPLHSVDDPMQTTGFLWCLYPIAAFVGLCEFILGVVHVFFCLPFYSLFIPFASGIPVIITSIHAFFLRFPNRVDFYLQFASTLTAIPLFATSLLEAFCLRHSNDEHAGGIDTTSICYGIQFRVIPLQMSCNDLLIVLQETVMAKFGSSVNEKHTVQLFVSSFLAVLAMLQLCACATLTVYSATQTKVKINSSHIIGGLSVFVLGFSLLHLFFCGSFFFLHLPSLVGLFGLLQAVLTCLTNNKQPRIRMLNVSGAALGLALAASTSFGFLCWSSSVSGTHHPYNRVCSWPKSKYAFCYRSIEFTAPYIEWTKEQVYREVHFFQFVTYSVLFLLGLGHFFLSLKVAFVL